MDGESETFILVLSSTLMPGVANGGSGHGARSGSAKDSTLIAHSLRADGFDASEDGTGRGTPLVPVAFNARQDPDSWTDRSGPIDTDGSTQAVGIGAAVRRLTPRECERLQGFPDDYTLIPYRGGMAKDGPRYKALGNSMAVPCMSWIGQRIAMVEALRLEAAA